MKLKAFLENFTPKLVATPTVFGSTVLAATEFKGLSDDFIARLTTTNDAETRTKAAVTRKNTSKRAVLARLRQLIRVIDAHPGVTDGMRVDLGLHVRDVVPTPVPAPATRPNVLVDPDGAFRLGDETMTDRRAKPAGVVGAVILTKITEAAVEVPPSADEAQFALLATRTRSAVPVPASAKGKTLWVFARWYNLRGELGPVSPPASTVIAA